MGQLEKYGLYVLCLVIFLILGVAIWGDPEPAFADRGGSSATPAASLLRTAPDIDLNALMSPVPKPATPSRRPVQEQADGRRDGVDDGSLPVTAETGRDHGRQREDREPPPPERPTRTIRSGDTFEGIARQALGDGRFVPLLRQLNPTLQPERLQPGKTLVLPTAAELAEFRGPAAGKQAGGTDGEQAGSRTYRIERGDTLEGLAKRFYGKDYASRLKDIKQLNPTVDPTRLRIGQLIRLPAN